VKTCPSGRARASRPVDAVEAGRMICPLGIVEIQRVAGESVGLQRKPRWIGQVRAGFHHDEPAASPSDVEAKLIRPDAEATIAGLHMRLPQRSRTAAKRRAPFRGSRQVIDRRIVVTVEHRRTNGGGVPLEIDPCQAGARKEPKGPDAGEFVTYRDVGQAGAPGERSGSDAGDVVGNRYAGQAGAPGKRGASDAGDAVGDGVAFGFPPPDIG
jgi:hypothetical protein